MLFKLNFNSKTQLVNSLMKLKGIIPKSKKNSAYYSCQYVDVNITSEGINFLTTDGFRICNLKLGEVENLEEDYYFSLSSSLFSDVINYIKSLNKVTEVALKEGNIVGAKVTGIKNGETVEKWFTECRPLRLPQEIYQFVEYPTVIKRNISFKHGKCKTIINETLLKTLRELKKRSKDKKILTLKQGGGLLTVGVPKTGFKFNMIANEGNSDLVGIDREYLMHALRNIDKATIEFYDDLGPIRITSENSEQLIMPVRV